MKSVVPVTVVEIKTACSQCNLRELCLPFGLDPGEVNQLDELVGYVDYDLSHLLTLPQNRLRFDLLTPIEEGSPLYRDGLQLVPRVAGLRVSGL